MATKSALCIPQENQMPIQSRKTRNKSMKLSVIALSVIVLSQQIRAQESVPKDDWKPAPSNQGGKEYPQYNSEGRVKFRIVAPEAKSVGCTFRDSSEFKKGDD